MEADIVSRVITWGSIGYMGLYWGYVGVSYKEGCQGAIGFGD